MLGFMGFVGALLAGVSVGDDAEKQAAVASLVGRQQAIQNIEIRYTIDEAFSPSPPAKEVAGDGSQFRAVTQPAYVSALFRRAGDSLYFERRDDPARPNEDQFEYFVHSITATATQHLFKSRNRPVAQSMFYVNRQLPYDSFIDLALGLRALDQENEWLTADHWRRFTATLPEAGKLSLEWLDGSTKHVWTFDRNQGDALSRYQVFYGDASGATIDAGDYREVGGLLLPHVATLVRYDAVGTETSRATCRVQSYLAGTQAAAAVPSIVCPNGTMVFDHSTKALFVVKDGPRPVDAAWLAQQIAASYRPQPTVSRATAVPWVIALNVALLTAIGVVVVMRWRQRSQPVTEGAGAVAPPDPSVA